MVICENCKKEIKLEKDNESYTLSINKGYVVKDQKSLCSLHCAIQQIQKLIIEKQRQTPPRVQWN